MVRTLVTKRMPPFKNLSIRICDNDATSYNIILGLELIERACSKIIQTARMHWMGIIHENFQLMNLQIYRVFQLLLGSISILLLRCRGRLHKRAGILHLLLLCVL